MTYSWFLWLSYSIFIAALLGWVRFAKIDPAFRPFLLCLWLGAANEIISILLPGWGVLNTSINNNIYVLIESALLLWQLWRWDAFGSRRRALIPLIVSLALLWCLENFYLSTIHQTDAWFRLAASFCIVFLAINVFARLMVTERTSLIRHPVFLICTGFVLYFTYKILVEIFWLYGLNNDSPQFMTMVYALLAWVNLLSNLIYAIAVIWIPARQPFTMYF